MSIEFELRSRSQNKCELCSATKSLSVYEVPPYSDGSLEQILLICKTCSTQINASDLMDPNHWRCLNDSMWSQVPAVQVMAWRMLTRLSEEGWPQELLEMLYLEESVLVWAKAIEKAPASEDDVKHIDSNGVELTQGDTVVLTKDLNVEGAGFTAKRGTSVRGISLVSDNAEHIEGRVNGQQIVILTKFIKKSN
ncbi:Protein PhnA [hydrothermal vent metagenome]|uniref:Protein PhnA n=1 Tax=hydrothermal vent metagenome TaxID=652676 RepID=A0A3B0YU64_9ZZZZ